MGGVILETLSTRKLVGFTVFALLCLFVCFLLGGLIAPRPYNVQQLLSTKCIDRMEGQDKRWLEPWSDPSEISGKPCDHLNFLDSDRENRIITERINSNMVVFAIRFPLRKENTKLDMSRWQQNIVAVLHVDVEKRMDIAVAEVSEMSIEARLGYKDDIRSNWTELAHSTETRTLKCIVGTSGSSVHELSEGYDEDQVVYHCDMLPLFELGSVHYNHYIINLRLPAKENSTLNEHIPLIENIWIFAIHPNGGFVKVWLSVKTVMCPLVIAALVFHVCRVWQLKRSFSLLERSLVALGTAMTFLNFPVEYFSLWLNMPYLLLYADIRQGIFYSVLLCFWIIFAGEHLMDQIERNRLVIYWKHLSAVGFGCIALFVFEMCERGVQLHNPFFSIWATTTGSNMAYGFIVLAGIAGSVYFLFLLYMIVSVFKNISAKKSSLPQMSKARRKFYMGLIYRFNFLMAMTLLCAAFTVVFFIIGQVAEGHWKWEGEQKLEYSSAVLTGVYGMWNIYVGSLLMLYAPSTKHLSTTSDASDDEVIEFANMPSEASALTALAQKVDLD